MKHDHAHKGGGSGKRLTPFCGEITDYECAKIPLHDFRRVYNQISLQGKIIMLKCSHKYQEEKILIVYDKLGDYLKSQNKKYSDVQKELSLSPTLIAKFQKNRNVNTDTINKICEYLKVQPSEIMEWIPDEEYNKANAKKIAIEQQIAELQKQLKEI